jgi:dienelactone hydrolase
VLTEDVEYFHHDRRLVGYLAVDDTSPGQRPAVLVSHDAGGLSDHPKDTARRLAQLGYAAFALDYYGDGARLAPDQVGARFSDLAGDPEQVRAIGRAGLEVLVASPYADPARAAAIGYCFGGSLSLELARSGADLRAVVGFHSGLATTWPAEAGTVMAKVLVCIGADDPIVPPDQRTTFEEEMEAAGVDWQLHLYGGAVHSFTNPEADGANPALRYDRDADQRSWTSMLSLFGEVF